MNLRRYHLLEPIGSGSFGTVYRADMLSGNGFSKVVAVKILRPEVASRADMTTRLRDEARLLALLRHRAMVQVDGLVQVEGRWAVVMEYVEGVSLLEASSVSRVPLGVALEILAEVASALHVAWNQAGPNGAPLHLVHRDIKPSNLLLTAAGGVKLLDFGIARAEFQERESSTSAVLMGSYGYMAPERLDGVDGPEGDVYALGVVFYELVVGERLGRTSSNPSRHAGFLQAAIRRFSRVVGDDAYEATELLGTLLSYEPSARPTARTLETTLRRMMRTHTGESLSEWAERVVPFLRNQHRALGDGELDLSGVTLAEQPTGRPPLLQLPADPDTQSTPFDFENHTFPIDPTPPPIDPTPPPTDRTPRPTDPVPTAVEVVPDEPPRVLAEDPPSQGSEPPRPSVDEPTSQSGERSSGGRASAGVGPPGGPLAPEPSFLTYVEAARVVRPGETRRDVLIALSALIVVLSIVLWAFAGNLKPRVQAVVAARTGQVTAPTGAGEPADEGEIEIEPSEPMDLSEPGELPEGRVVASQHEPPPPGPNVPAPDAALQHNQPTRAEPTRAEPARAEPARAEPARAEPTRAEPPPAPRGTVRAGGDPATLRLVGPAGSFPPGRVPAGAYEVMASFDGAPEVTVGRVDVIPGQSVVLQCKKAFLRCVPQGE